MSSEALEPARRLQGAVRAMATNLAKVLGGQGTVLVFALATLTLNSRALGAHDFGALVVIQSICEFMGLVAAFQTWQAMVRFGAAEQARGDFAGLRARYRLGLAMDFAAAVVAAGLAALVASLFFKIVGLRAEHAPLALVYALSTAVNATSSSTGVLRLTGRFGMAAAIQVAGAALLFANALLLWALGQPLETYVWSIAAIMGLTSLCTIAAAFFVTERLAGGARPSTSAPFSRGAFIRFAVATSLSSSLNALRQRGEVLIVSGLLGPAAAGLYAVAYRVAGLIDRFAEAGRQSSYPEMARLVIEGGPQAGRVFAARTSAFAAAVAIPALIATVMLARDVLTTAFGDQYAAASPILIWLVISSATFLCVFSQSIYTQIVFGAKRVLIINLLATTVFLAGAVAGPISFGVSGVGLGAALFAPTFALLIALHTFVLSPPRLSPSRDARASLTEEAR